MSDKRDLFGDEIPDNDVENFETMLDQTSGVSTRKLRSGDKFKGQLLIVGKVESFASTGTPQDAVILTADLKDEAGNVIFKVGDLLELVVTKVKDDEVRATRKNSKSAVTELENLEDAMDMELAVEGRVLELIKGGFRVSVLGHKAFCPISQIDIAFIKDGSEFVGKKLDFMITKMDAGNKNIIVSRKKIMELQRAETEGELLKTLKVGDLIEGKITRVENFGAFVELAPGVEGLVHISEISWGRIKSARDVAVVGASVRVKVLKIDDEGPRLNISLSIKEGGGELDPWLQVANKFPVGTILEGTVDKKEAFGLFVVLAPGITGLLPKSKWRDSGDASKYENKRKGEPILIRVDEISFETHRLTLGLPEEGDDGSWKSHTGNASGFGTMAGLFNQANNKPKK